MTRLKCVNPAIGSIEMVHNTVKAITSTGANDRVYVGTMKEKLIFFSQKIYTKLSGLRSILLKTFVIIRSYL